MEKEASDIIAAIVAAAKGETKKVPPAQWDKLDTPIEYQGRAITLPDDPGRMPMQKAVEALERRIADESTVFEVHEVIDAFPTDALVAVHKAMAKLYGFSSVDGIDFGFFKTKPAMLSVKTGPKDEDVIQVPAGQFTLPGVESKINVTTSSNRGRPCLVIHGNVAKTHRHLFIELANMARAILREESIYRGRALRIGNTDDGLDLHNPPDFLDVSDTTESELVFDDDVKAQIDVNILTPIRATVGCRKNKIPLKRGILLEGPYGTGKSLTARLVAAECERNGWTFILLDNVSGLREALEFAKAYQPAVVFAEDIDRVAAIRDDAMNDLINTIDGVVSKRTEIMVVLTTNHADRLDPVILRPGRLDAIVSLRAPGPQAVERLLRHYAGRLVHDDQDLSGAGQELSGQIPAVIREAVERAKLAMVGRGDNQLIDSDLVVAATTMRNHLDLLNRRKPTRDSVGDRLAAAMAEAVQRPLGNGDEPAAVPEDVFRRLDSILERVEDVREYMTDHL